MLGGSVVNLAVKWYWLRGVLLFWSTQQVGTAKHYLLQAESTYEEEGILGMVLSTVAPSTTLPALSLTVSGASGGWCGCRCSCA